MPIATFIRHVRGNGITHAENNAVLPQNPDAARETSR